MRSLGCWLVFAIGAGGCASVVGIDVGDYGLDNGSSTGIAGAAGAAGGGGSAGQSSCAPGTGDCDGVIANGCETSTMITVSDCGACGHACHSTSCADGECGGACDSGWLDCNAAPADGCEASVSAPSSCGGCGNACHSTTCAGGVCGGSCDLAWGDCDGDITNGCELDVTADMVNCGACARVCHSAACVGGNCGGACDAGWTDCDGNVANGCEADTQSDVAHCGSCSNACHTATCAAGSCGGACAPGWLDCDASIPTDGCEASASSPSSCGACGKVCHSATCSAGACGGACDAGWGDCDGVVANGCETDTSSSGANCGACGHTCHTATCSSGSCTGACEAGWLDCNGSKLLDGCESSTSSPTTCGGCGKSCHSAACAAGACGGACDAGWADCDGDVANGCETDSQSSGANCGTCGHSCGASETCGNGVCLPTATATGTSCQTSGLGLTDCGDGGSGTTNCCTSILVPGGTFYRNYDGVSASYSSIAFPATVSTFRLDKYEITVGRFRQFVQAVNQGWTPPQGSGKHAYLNGGSGLAATAGGFESGWDDAWGIVLPTDTAVWSDASHLGSDAEFGTWTALVGGNEKMPLNCATWWQYYAFCIWDGGFLPSETEWNYAAAAGSEQRVFPWSNPPQDETIDCSYANYAGLQGGNDYCVLPGVGSTSKVGTYSPKADGKWGHADLAGNLLDWTMDTVPAPYGDFDGLTSPCHDCANLTNPPRRGARGGYFFDPRPTASGHYAPEPTGYATQGARCARAP